MKFNQFLINCVCGIFFAKTEPIERLAQYKDTRRILQGHEVTDTKPYMVYLRPANAADPQISNTNWLCGGVIIHERYILTSAACIEDVKHFYVVSGTNKWIPSTDQDNLCIKYGAKKAIWKCVPQDYNFDGTEFDNIRWMSNDIAVVKVEDNFNFEKRVKGCDFIPKKIAFNNQSAELEQPKTVGNTAGWGSTDRFADPFKSTALNSPVLLETDVVLISKKNCKKRWEPRYHDIIDESMICVKDSMDTDAMSMACSEQQVNCKELVYSEEEDENDATRRFMVEPDDLEVHSAAHHGTRRRKGNFGGFCENDHGGPLVVGQGRSAVVVGVISACLARNITKKCYGPFLYTSVWKNRHLISCTIDKEIGATCRKFLETTQTAIKETTYNWTNHRDGLAKVDEEIKQHNLRSSIVKEHNPPSSVNTTKSLIPTPRMRSLHGIKQCENDDVHIIAASAKMYLDLISKVFRY